MAEIKTSEQVPYGFLYVFWSSFLERRTFFVKTCYRTLLEPSGESYQITIFQNKTRTSKVGAISKAQKAQNIIFEKTNIHSVAKYQISKKLKGGPFGGKFFLKKSHNAEKLKGGPFEVFQHPFCRKT